MTVESLEPRLTFNAGGLDPSFGVGGQVLDHFAGEAAARAVALQPDGKLVVAGAGAGYQDFAVARYLPNGQVDHSFGQGGKVLTPFRGTDNAADVAIQADGKIILVGESEGDVAIARYLADGSRDWEFGEGGQVLSHFSGYDVAYAVAVQPDGKIVVAGQSQNDILVARYQPNGTLDSSFGGKGYVQTHLGVQSWATDVIVRPGGEILTVGAGNKDFALVQYDASGRLDTGFNGSGIFLDHFAGTDAAWGLALQEGPMPRLAVAGSSEGDFALGLYTLDAGSIGTAAKVRTNFGGEDMATAVAFQADGKVVVGGAGINCAQFALARYLPDGTLDASFGMGGQVTMGLTGDDYAEDLVIQPDGKIVVVGFCGGGFGIVRYLSDAGTAPTVSVSDVAVKEGQKGAKAAAFEVRLSAASPQFVTVHYATMDGTATQADGDYQAAQGTLTFTPGEIRKTVKVAIQGDARFEADEVLSLVLSNPTDATLVRAAGVATIRNDDAAPQISVADVAVAENARGVDFTVRLSAASGLPVSIAFASADKTALSGNDYVARAGMIEFAPGVTERTIHVPLIDDAAYEGTQTFQLQLANPQGAKLARGRGTATIGDDDPPPEVHIADIVMTEPSSGTVQAGFTVSLVGSTELPVSVRYATAGATATAGRDFRGVRGTLTFAPGQSQKTISVPVLGDKPMEPTETFFVNLSRPTGARLGKSQGVGTIQDAAPAGQPLPALRAALAAAEGESSAVLSQPKTEAAHRSFYIDSMRGSDANPGTAAQPWKTYRNIVSYYSEVPNSAYESPPPQWVALEPGDEIHFLAGDYNDAYEYSPEEIHYEGLSLRDVHGTAEEPIRLIGHPGARLAARAPDRTEMSVMHLWESSYIEVSGFEIAEGYGNGLTVSQCVGLNVHNNWIHDIDGINENNLAGIHVITSSDIDIYDNLLHDNYERARKGQPPTNPENGRHMVFMDNTGPIHVHHNSLLGSGATDPTVIGVGMTVKHAGAGSFEADHNIIVGAWDNGIGTGSSDSYIHHNLILDSDAFRVTDFGGYTTLDDIVIAHNTLVSDDSGSTRGGGLNYNPTDEYAPIGTLTFAGNLIYDRRDYDSEHAVINVHTYGPDRLYDLTVTAGNLTIEGNAYFNPERLLQFNLFCANGGHYGSVGASYDWTGWQSLGYDTQGFAGDPLLDEAFRPHASQASAAGWYAGDQPRLTVLLGDEPVTAGQAVAGTVTRSGVAFDQPLVVTLNSSNPDLVDGTQVVIPAGQATASFSVTTQGTGLVRNLGVSRLTASAAGLQEHVDNWVRVSVSSTSNEVVVPLPTSGPANDLVLRRNGDDLQLLRRRDGRVLFQDALQELNALRLQGAENRSDTVTLDLAAGGPFVLPGGLAFQGGAGRQTDSLVIRAGTQAGMHKIAGDVLSVNGLSVTFAEVERVDLEGGPNDDVYHISRLSVPLSLREAGGSDHLDFSEAAGPLTLDLTKSRGTRQNVLAGQASLALRGSWEEVVGTPRSDTIKGTASANRIWGMGGADFLDGGSGDDLLDGGAGNDRLAGGPGNDVLLGGEGDDELRDSRGRNLLIGGLGADRLYGSSGDDILIGGCTNHDSHEAALRAVVAEWGIPRRPLQIRVEHLQAGTGLNEPYRLSGEDLARDDGAPDELWGGSSSDWFLSGDLDACLDRGPRDW